MQTGLTTGQDRFDTLAALVHRADGRPMSALIAEAGLDPARDLVGCNFRGMDFRGSDLDGYDFTECDLRRCQWDLQRDYARTVFMGAMFGTNDAPMLPEDRQRFRDILHDPRAPWPQKFKLLGIYLETYGMTETAFRVVQMSHTMTTARAYRLSSSLLAASVALSDRVGLNLSQQVAAAGAQTLPRDLQTQVETRVAELRHYLETHIYPRRTPADVAPDKLIGLIARVVG